MEKAVVPLVIIGSGPAGYTAAIYAARAGLSPIVYQGKQPGGLLTTTTEVENYPGYPDGVQGIQMMIDLEKQARRFGATMRSGCVVQVDFSKRPFQVIDEDGVNLYAQTVIIATGASPKPLGIAREKDLQGHGISVCAVCDGFFFRNKDVAVVGGGDSAAEESLYLSKICRNVIILVRKQHMRASKIMQDRIRSCKNITLYFNTEVSGLLGDIELTGIKIVNKNGNTECVLTIQGLFVAIGHQPNTAIFSKQLKLDKRGYIQTKNGGTETNIPGVFAAGDVQDAIYRQAITAAGTGCMAAIDAERFLSAQM